jgi:thiamine transporter ThiT
MRARPIAWLMTALSLVMIAVVIMRVRRGWPAGPKTYAFIAGTVTVIVVAIVTWRRPSADQTGSGSRS